MKNAAIFCVILFMEILSLSACSPKSSMPATQSDPQKNRLSVVTTIFPQYDFTRQIAADQVDVQMLLKPGAESHSFEPTPQDIKTIQNSDLFIYTGSENDMWVEDLLNAMGSHKPDTLKLVDCVPAVMQEIVQGMEHTHSHAHTKIVEDEIENRTLSDFSGDYQSVLPLFEDGALDQYIQQHAQEDASSFDHMKEEFLKKYATEYRILSIRGSEVSMKTAKAALSSDYIYTGFYTVKDEENKIKSVWYTFESDSSTEGMPRYLALNDHKIKNASDAQETQETAHLHLRYTDESMDALVAMENWTPTFFDADASAEQIKEAISNHTDHHAQEMDEHIWTSPKNAIEIVRKISALLSEKDANNAQLYQKNSTQYIARLEQLDRDFQQVVDTAARREILFGDRFPFRYLTDAYGLEYHAAFSGCSVQTQASASTLAFLIDRVKTQRLPVVFTIELSNEKIADSICEATGAQKLLLHSCHNLTKEQFNAGESYLSIMQQNLQNLKKALN